MISEHIRLFLEGILLEALNNYRHYLGFPPWIIHPRAWSAACVEAGWKDNRAG